MALSRWLQASGYERVATPEWLQTGGYKTSRVVTDEWLQKKCYKYLATSRWPQVDRCKSMARERERESEKERDKENSCDFSHYFPMVSYGFPMVFLRCPPKKDKQGCCGPSGCCCSSGAVAAGQCFCNGLGFRRCSTNQKTEFHAEFENEGPEASFLDIDIDDNVFYTGRPAQIWQKSQVHPRE